MLFYALLLPSGGRLENIQLVSSDPVYGTCREADKGGTRATVVLGPEGWGAYNCVLITMNVLSEGLSQMILSWAQPKL